jgi:hypothetical protein
MRTSLVRVPLSTKFPGFFHDFSTTSFCGEQPATPQTTVACETTPFDNPQFLAPSNTTVSKRISWKKKSRTDLHDVEDCQKKMKRVASFGDMTDDLRSII